MLVSKYLQEKSTENQILYNKSHYLMDQIRDQKKKNKNESYWVSTHQSSSIDTSKYDYFATFDVSLVDIEYEISTRTYSS